MSLSQTYFVAASARSKLGKEAARGDHDLRLLVGHANLLDTLMVDLADAEREQEAWFNQSIRKASKNDEPKHIRWVDTVIEDDEDDSDSDSDSDDGSDFDPEDIPIAPLRRFVSPPAGTVISSTEIEDEEYELDDEEEYEDFEDDEEHALVRTPSQQMMPELVHDEAESDDESTPPSPPQAILEFAEDQKEAIATTSFFDSQPMDYVMTEQPTMIASY